MRPRRFVLLVEDNIDHVGTWKTEFGEFNEDGAKPFIVDLQTASTLAEARNILEESYIDAAIVDLRIPSGGSGDAGAESGNEAVREIVDTISGPIAIFSAHAGEAAPFIERTPIRAFPKELGQTTAIIDWFCEHAPLMQAVGKAVSDIRRETARIFSGMIWQRWEQTKDLNLTDEQLQQVVTRQVVSHVAEQLSLPLNNAPPYHAYEVYFKPPLRTDRLHTGDLLALNGEVYVIVTPQCDMVRDYPDSILLAKCKEIASWATVSEEKRRRYASQGHANKSHFLPPCDERGPWTAEFNSLRTVAKSDAADLLLKRFASIAPQFIPNLVQRLSSFIGRIGQPDLDV